MKLIATPRFERATKKLHSDEKQALDDAVRTIAAHPIHQENSGEMKKGDLAGMRVFKYRHNTQLLLLAYRVAEDQEVIKLLSFGSHENFYRNLKRD